MRLVKERGVAVAQAARDLDVHENVLRKWLREQTADLQQVFPGRGVMKLEAAEIERLKKEVAKLRMERDILKKAAAYFAKESMWSPASWRSTGGAICPRTLASPPPSPSMYWTASSRPTRRTRRGWLGCCRFRRHLVKVRCKTGGGLWRQDGSSAERPSLRR